MPGSVKLPLTQGQGPSLQEPVRTVKEDVELKAAFLFQRS